MKLAVLCAPQSVADFESALPAISRAGFDGVTLEPGGLFHHPQDFDVAERRALRSRLAQYNLQFAGFYHLLAGHGSLGLFGGEDSTRQTVELLKAQIRLCDDLGGNLVTLGSPLARKFEPTIKASDSIELAAQLIEALLPALEARHVTFALDPLPLTECGFLTSLEAALRLQLRLKHPLIRLGLNLTAFYAGREDEAALLSRYLPYLASVQVADSFLPQAGEFVGRSIAQNLAAARFRGWCMLKPNAERARAKNVAPAAPPKPSGRRPGSAVFSVASALGVTPAVLTSVPEPTPGSGLDFLWLMGSGQRFRHWALGPATPRHSIGRAAINNASKHEVEEEPEPQKNAPLRGAK